jgi:hypothetical protein
MHNGIYRLDFRSGQKIGASGIAVLKDGSVNGGDDGFVYRGSYHVEGPNVTAQVAVSKHNPGAQSVLGPIENYTLVLTGTATPYNFTLSGVVVGREELTIEIRGVKLAEAA